MPWSLRPATMADAERLAAVVAEAFEGYRSIAPPGWEPPDPQGELDRLREDLASDGVWCLVAEEGTQLAGQVAIMPARIHRHPAADTAMAHLWQLFVRPPWWGTGLATELHTRAIQAATARGFSSMRLFTPAAQARARRFYEREGWTVAGDPPVDLDLGIPIVEYRRAISSSV
ncbi:MAG TPA: GNAT family N-acetyltransferase [Thermoleophilaceae bacterium]|nr:GNAT family N-acetyltransferase [Thermoleophilaceae bacterium]